MTNNTPDYEDNLYFYDYVIGIKVERSDKLIKENARLKELLKECRHIIGIEKDFETCHFGEHTLVELLAKIDEALKCQE